jgi:hypothetical protein
MGYLIEQSYINKTTTIIPEADILLMNQINAYTIVDNDQTFSILPIAIYIKYLNSTTAYTGYTHLHARNGGVNVVGGYCATLNENSIDLGTHPNYIMSMLINFQASPNRFGGFNAYKALILFFDSLPTAGDGDWEVNTYWIKQVL